ncbi:MAG: vgr related protein [Sphingomonadaceae bacterium]|nr:vgr related protein [Sphingomonadaceae bacterium]
MKQAPGRPLTEGESALGARLFGGALDPVPVRIHCRRWWPLQPRNVVMAPDGAIWVHPEGTLWRDDYAICEPALTGLFVHELTHVWQHQCGIRLPLRRHPFCRYPYRYTPGRPLRRYGIEQQAEIVRDAWKGLAGLGPRDPRLEALLPAREVAEAGANG